MDPKAVRDEVEDYEQTVHVLLAFAALIIYDGSTKKPDTEFGFGRRMGTSATNPISPDNSVTPDLVVQGSATYGVVAEVKKSLSKNKSYWVDHADQLLKYDDDLLGWWTEDSMIGHSDTIMLIHQSRGREFTRFLQDLSEKTPNKIGPTTSVVEFNRSEEAVPYYFFRISFGTIEESNLFENLDIGMNVPLTDVLTSFPSVRYYDSRPPIILLLEQLWIDVFPSFLDRSERDEETNVIKIPVSVSEVTKEMQLAYGSGALFQDDNSVEFPKIKWIKRAFEWFVKQDMATPPVEGNDDYIILNKRIRKDVRQRLIELNLKSSDKAGESNQSDEKQGQLFFTDEI